MVKKSYSNIERPGDVKKSAGHIILVSLALGLIIWHTVLWHNNGVQARMLAWTGTAKVYLLILYNLALMVIMGTLLGILMGKISRLFNYRVTKKQNGKS
jgi:hypothetical protein